MAKDELIGQQLGEYRLEKLIGQGAMARVYRGIDIRQKHWVAIKVIRSAYRTDTKYMKRLEREAQVISQLIHPHIVRFYRYGELDGLLYMAMQYVEGETLDLVIDGYHEENKRVPTRDIRRVTRHICWALDHAHSQGIIHRDIKPANIILDRQGNAILTDFGLALLVEVGTQGEVFGTPHYISPEQAISSAAVVPQSDLYSVGVMLYEMCTGQLPFNVADPLELAMLHMTEPPPPPRQVRPDLSPEVEEVILKTLAKKPEERYPNGAALADALDRAMTTKRKSSSASSPKQTAADRTGTTKRSLPSVPAALTESEPASTKSKSATPRSKRASKSTRSEGGEGQPQPPADAAAPALPAKGRPWLIYLIVGIGILVVVGFILMSIMGG